MPSSGLRWRFGEEIAMLSICCCGRGEVCGDADRVGFRDPVLELEAGRRC